MLRDEREYLSMWHFPYRSQRPAVIASNVVSTSQPLASQAGIRMMLDGGNAVDGALAAAIALTVLEPTGNGIGSDAFALVWDTRNLNGINGSGKSPAAWTFERFSHLQEMPKLGWDSVTVPGAVSVWKELSTRFGSVPFRQLFEPAIEYAKNGFPVSPIIADKWSKDALLYKDYDAFGRIFLPHGEPPEPGATFYFTDAVATLEEIARTKGESFYRGDLATEIAHFANQQGGAMSLEDLQSHEAMWVDPISQVYRGKTVYELPPNGQGIAPLIALGILEHFDIGQFTVDSADSIHLQVEAMKLAFADVMHHLADPQTMKIDFSKMLAPDYLKQRAALINFDQSRSYLTGIPDSGGTVYLAAADSDGMMVSFIQSNYHGFGSGIVVPGTGISLNNRGAGFTLDKKHPNCVGGAKRPFHTIIPGFVMENCKPLMAFGVMGAHMQAQGHVQMMTRIFDYGQNPQAASDGPRWHVMPTSELALEDSVSETVRLDLEKKGHRIITGDQALFGGAQLVLRSKHHYIAGSDHRKDGLAVGF